MRWALLLSVALAAPTWAQDEDTLADIRQQLSVLQVEMQRLQGELNTSGAPGVTVAGGTVLERVDAIEAELRRLTQATERMQFRIESVARDGGNRIEDLRFQLCELTENCDLGALPEPGPLGGETEGPAPTGTAAAPTTPEESGPQLAIGEQVEFDAARRALDEGRNGDAAQLFLQFVTTYPTGPLTGRAQMLRGQALAADGQPAEAARAYLEAFSGAPEGPDAPEALLGLGQALGALGQTNEACLTLDEVSIRFPQAPAAGQAQSARAGLGCS
ncbi:MAG: tol-pal system protein YbgF [Pseudomonadota bacterium]